LEEIVNRRQVVVRPGRHLGWWVEGRWANGHLFMMSWFPIEVLARAVASLVASRPERDVTSSSPGS
jgi:hypothetical protein